MREENIQLAIKSVTALILQKYPDLTGGEKLKNIAMGKIKNMEDVLEDSVTEKEKEFIIREAFANCSRKMEDGIGLFNPSTFNPWYNDRKGKIKNLYWDDYKLHLKVNENWNDKLTGPISKLDVITNSIIESCADPLKRDSYRKGMVVGNVQSGKTANYLGLICKAADAGYKVIIVVAGMLEELRKQTQTRLEESFVGFNDLKGERVGVGTIKKRDLKFKPICVTDRDTDFTKAKTNSDLINITQSAPYVIVVKKNKNTLVHLNTWLNKIRKNGNFEDEKIPLPLLLIDDEADNASINVKGRRKKAKKSDDKKIDPLEDLYPEENPENFNVTAINQKLRLILTKFTTATYVGYTATPFANIFISPKTWDDVLQQDLFPSDFIFYLGVADNYFGPTQAFLQRQKYPKFLKEIDIEETLDGSGITIPHKKDFRLDDVPESLKDAIKSFIVTTSIRWSEGYKNKHASMLVNASCYSDVQISIAEVINSYKNLIADSLSASSGLEDEYAEKNSKFYREIKEVWQSDFAKDKPEINWIDLKSLVNMVANKIHVVVVNRVKGVSEKLNYDDYPNGRIVIAVGGYSLSRGLTLYGLNTSYYLRTSRMYDTLLQMGRWFGYRDHYENICRLYMTETAIEDFSHIAEVINHLNNQIKVLQTQRKTPKEFALSVRTHPEVKRLMVTSRLKLGSAEKVKITLTYEGKLVSNYLIPKDKISIKNNAEKGFDFIRKLSTQFSEQILGVDVNKDLASKYAFRNIPFEEIYNITNNHIISSDNVQIDQASFLTYLKERSHELKNWDVIIDSASYRQMGGIDVSGLNIRPVSRLTRIDERYINNSKSITTVVGKKNQIISNDIANITASADEILEAKNLIKSYDGKLGLAKAISLITSRPILFITIYRLTIDKFNPSDIYFEKYKELEDFAKDTDIYFSLSYRLPQTGIEETPIEVYRNADIDKVLEDDDQDDGDD